MELPRPSARRIYYLHLLQAGGLERLDEHLDRVQALGFDTVLIPPVFAPGADGDVFITGDPAQAHPALGGGAFEDLLRVVVGRAGARGLDLLMDLALARVAAEHPLVAAHPEAFALRRMSGGEAPIDPRRPAPLAGEARARLDDAACAEPLAAFAVRELKRWAACGLKGVRVLKPDAAAPMFWAGVIAGARKVAPEFVFIAETEGVPRPAVLGLAGCGFDALTSSLPYWDGRARWFVEEYEALRPIAPLIAELEPPFGQRLAARMSDSAAGVAAAEQKLMLAAATGAGLLLPMGFEAGAAAPLDPRGGDAAAQLAGAPAALSEAVRAANAVSGELSRFTGELRVLTGEGAAVTALLRANAADVRRATAALLILINPNLSSPARLDTAHLLSAAGAEFGDFARVDGNEAPFAPLRPGEVRLLLARRSVAIMRPVQAGPTAAETAAQAPRLVVEGVTPRVEGGPFPVRRVVGETVEVEVDLFGDGHEQLSAELQWRALDEAGWRTAPMTELGNDRWRGRFPLDRLGRYEFVVEGWLDVYAGFRRDYRKKRDAGVAQPVDVQEGQEFVKAACKRSKGDLKARLKIYVDQLKGAADDVARGETLLDEPLAELMRQADERLFSIRSEPQLVDAERLQARFASWYELFPRSQTDDPARHGTFDDVIGRLPQVRAMGFDVLYFPPIHPIGRKNMKGKNNSLTPTEDDVGSPYAIGSKDGGHDAIHPDLGAFEDFRRLIRAAAEQGLEIALDFAVQCSPDHPWLKEHPGWFDWRPDGTIKYAENPPKKYQDIVNVDFYKPDAVPDLWLKLRDIVLMWVGEGVKLFRVDNPHTKPLPFWEWLIREVRTAHPDTVFLAEAFTRPKVMYRLAKIGFSQSYTYFTWRHTKSEFIEYMTELTQAAPREFFRPHFFVNTPDINPVFLQTSGRGGFLIRAALASMLSGLFGVYAGFELCEFEPLPGREEYKDSEKYEIRVRPRRAPGDIVDEITRLNRIRKGHPALQTHLGVEFLPSWNDNVLVFAKATPGLDDVVVVAISLDPHGPQDTHFELPLWRWGVPDVGGVEVEDLVWEQRFTWIGKTQHVRLDPNAPYAIWSPRVPPKAA
jgi:starch synthase (maltosyl-transferring)